MYTIAIKRAIKKGSQDGFTTSIKGDAKRYIIALTNNNDYTIEKLESQAVSMNYKNVNVGGWTDIKTNRKYIDISTSLTSKKQAIELAKKYNQIAIWDAKDLKEVRTGIVHA